MNRFFPVRHRSTTVFSQTIFFLSKDLVYTQASIPVQKRWQFLVVVLYYGEKEPNFSATAKEVLPGFEPGLMEDYESKSTVMTTTLQNPKLCQFGCYMYIKPSISNTLESQRSPYMAISTIGFQSWSYLLAQFKSKQTLLFPKRDSEHRPRVQRAALVKLNR